MDIIHVIKIGGAVVNYAAQLQGFLKTLAQQQTTFILVHGGGRKVNEWLEKIGQKPNMVDGRRITDGQTLELAVMNYAGLLNKQIVARLQSHGRTALGLSGADLGCIQASKRTHPTIDYGYVGDIKKVNGEVFTDLCHRNIVPVCCAITCDTQGQLLNTNADTIASEVAIAVANTHQVKLWYAFEKQGVLLDVEDPSSLVPSLTKGRYSAWVAQGKIHSGMIPKLDNCFRALDKGVSEVNIAHVEAFHNFPHQLGTNIIAS
ncbi:MAG: acetylglutamate kinase [Saprospiraceae bacterium]|nr:acetylglutamate kinase [Saprospiraceae bacterium]